MPRRVGRSQLSIRRNRRKRPTKFRIHKAEWIDPFPDILGTRPEKMIFAELVARRIYFIYQGDWPIADRSISVLAQARYFKPDFIVPEYKVIFDPFSDYFHSTPAAIKSDYWKSVDYTGKGYEFVTSWSTEVEAKGGSWAVNQSKRILLPPVQPLQDAEDIYWKRVQGYRLGPNVGLGATSTAAANRRRRRQLSPVLRPSQGR